MKLNYSEKEKNKTSVQQAVSFTGADDADAEFSLPLTNFLTADNAAGD